jgi:hypothetical protein
VFDSFGIQTAKKYSKQEIEKILDEIAENSCYGTILRAKGIVDSFDCWIHFDYIPGEKEVRDGTAEVTGKICVIGSDLNKEKLAKLFN